jgi:hypothetical protein
MLPPTDQGPALETRVASRGWPLSFAANPPDPAYAHWWARYSVADFKTRSAPREWYAGNVEAFPPCDPHACGPYEWRLCRAAVAGAGPVASTCLPGTAAERVRWRMGPVVHDAAVNAWREYVTAVTGRVPL